MFSEDYNSNQTMFNFFSSGNYQQVHRSSVGSIPSMTSSSATPSSNESLRLAASNESLRLNDLRNARSNESLRYAPSNESFRKAFMNAPPMGTNANMFKSLEQQQAQQAQQVQQVPGNSFQPMSQQLQYQQQQQQQQQQYYTANNGVNFNGSGSSAMNSIYYDDYNEVEQMLQSATHTSFGSMGYQTQNMRKNSLNSLGNSSSLFGADFGDLSSPSNMQNMQSDITLRLNQFSFSGANTNANVNANTNTKTHRVSESLGSFVSQQPSLRSVGSYKDLKQGITNESLIEQKQINMKHTSKSQSVNLDNYDHNETIKKNRRKSEGNNKKDDKKDDKKSGEKELLMKYKNVPFEQLASKVVKLSMDQNGCRFLQRKLDEEHDLRKKQHIIDVIYKEIKPHIYELVIDPFGNYLIQKIFGHLSVLERTELIKACKDSFDEISLNQHGTRALQRMIENVSTQEQTDYIVNSLRSHVIRLIKDLNGNHVIQKCLSEFSSENCQFVIDGICENIVEVATHRHGCCVLQKCLDSANNAQFVDLGHKILKHGLFLMQDPFGNYVIQYLLPKKRHELKPNFADITGQQITGRLEDLSIQKFASNVVEKCLKFLNSASLRDTLVEEILNFRNLESVLKDPYGNYVVQTALEVATGDLRTKAIERIGALMPYVKNTPYARKIQSKLTEAEKRENEMS